MRIEIGRYVLKSNSHYFILTEEGKGGKDKDGKIKDKIIGYYATFESVLKAVPERALMMSDATDLKTLIDELKKYREIIEEALK